jgi:hypothetical protein
MIAKSSGLSFVIDVYPTAGGGIGRMAAPPSVRQELDRWGKEVAVLRTSNVISLTIRIPQPYGWGYFLAALRA